MPAVWGTRSFDLPWNSESKHCQAPPGLPEKVNAGDSPSPALSLGTKAGAHPRGSSCSQIWWGDGRCLCTHTPHPCTCCIP